MVKWAEEITNLYKKFNKRLKAEAAVLSRNKPSIKPEAAGRLPEGFMRGLFRDKTKAEAFNVFRFFTSTIWLF